MRVADVMTADVVTVAPDTSVMRAAELLASHGCLALPVVTETGELIGIVTEFDVLTSRFPLDPRQRPHPATVRDVMSQPVITVAPWADVRDLAEHMWRHRHRNLPVMANNQLVGFVTRTDLIRMLATESR